MIPRKEGCVQTQKQKKITKVYTTKIITKHCPADQALSLRGADAISSMIKNSPIKQIRDVKFNCYGYDVIILIVGDK